MSVARRILAAGAFLPMLLLAIPSMAKAQVPPGGRRQGPPPRAQLERRAMQAYSRAVHERLGLNEDQLRKLADVNRRFAEPRRALVAEERATRQTIMQQVRADSAADQGKISAALAQMIALQRKRIDLQEQEDRELAAFMTPLQRAKYHALQEVVRRRMENARRGPMAMRGDSSRP